MRIARSMLRHGNIMPEALGVIASIPDSLLYHVAHSRRHPASLYARSLSQVAKNWHVALDKIEKFTSAYLWMQDDSLLPEAVNAYRDLLFALYEHLDASYGCVRALVPPQTKNDPLLDTKFLGRAKVAGWKEFRLRIQPYSQNRIGAVVNSLKHNQSEMASFYLHQLPELRVGYCIRDVQSTGALGPAIRVHADGNSAFSFARDMLVHFWNLYFISSELADLIRRLIPTISTKNAMGYKNDSLNPTLEDLARRMSDLPLSFFPDEVRMPCPLVRWNPSIRELTIDMPGVVRPRRLPNGYQMRAAINVDMSHPTNKLPYFGKNAM